MELNSSTKDWLEGIRKEALNEDCLFVFTILKGKRIVLNPEDVKYKSDDELFLYILKIYNECCVV